MDSASIAVTARGKVADITGPDTTGAFGVTCADLGACVVAPNGKLVLVFGDTFSGRRVGEGNWRSPVVLIGTGDADHKIHFERAGGADPNYAARLWDYIHDDVSTGWTRGGISTVIPSDLLRVEDSLYLHAIVNRGFGTVIWTEVWTSADNGISWRHMGERAKFPGALHNGYAQCWSWDYDPDDGWVYVVSTGFQRDKGIILRRVRPEDIGDRWQYSGWGCTHGRWAWGTESAPISPGGETWGELCLRRLGRGKWILGGFLSSRYALGYRTIGSPAANLHEAPLQTPVTGSSWETEDHAECRVAQLYGGYVLPGSRPDVVGGAGLVVSQWNTATGTPYRAMQFKVTLKDTTTTAAQTPDPRWHGRPVPQLDFDDHRCAIIAETDVLCAAVDGADLTRAVPSCPGWNVGQLLRHLGGAQRWAAEMVRTRATGRLPEDQFRDLSGFAHEDPAVVVPWLAAGAKELADTLRIAGPDGPVDTAPIPDGTAMFYARRFTHETAIHRADAVLALGLPFTIDQAIAVDGIDEWMELGALPMHFDVHPWMRELLGPGRTLHFHATDTPPDAGAEWVVDLTGDALAWRRAHEKAAVAVRGPVADLLLVIYRRQAPDNGAVEILGDKALLDFWLQRVSFA